jgi:16S rRNA (cytosine967-C5)-methyltransferase
MPENSSSAANPRRIAAQALRAWENGHCHADETLTSLSRRSDLRSTDHALLQQLFYGVIRSLSKLDFLVDHLRRGKLSQENRNLLRLGLYQLFDTRMPVHAAVNETVNLARHRRDRSVINGVLRNADRQRDDLSRLLNEQPLAIRESHPAFLIDRWTEQFGSDTATALCEWNNQPPPVFLRINHLIEKGETGAGEKIRQTIAEHERTTPVEKNENFFRIDGPVPKEWIQRGWIYLQDPSTRLACELLAAQPGQQILDACAAPGGKTALLAESGASVTAVDRGEKRLGRLHENLQRLRADKLVEVHDLNWFDDNAGVTLGSSRFDAILVDAPCSNTGVMRRRVDVRWRLTAEEFKSQAAQQLRITEAVLPLLKPGGRLVYSTCSIDATENQAVIDQLLARHTALSHESSATSLPWRDDFDGAFAASLRKAAE